MGLDTKSAGIDSGEKPMGGHVIFLMLFSSFYGGLPKELEEAATIDGSGFMKTYSSIMLPFGRANYGNRSNYAVYLDMELIPSAIDCYAE